MTWIILATGFGAANFIAIALLFRRLRHNLNRQLSDMRAERNSEWILRALQGAPEEQARPARAAAVGGSHTPPLHPQPVRRKKHLGLYRGGAIAAAVLTLSAILRCGRQSHRAHLVSTALGSTAVAATTITMMSVAPWQQDINTVPPTPNPSVTMTQSPAPGSLATPTTVAPGTTAGRQQGATPARETGSPTSATAGPSDPAAATGGNVPGAADATTSAALPSTSPAPEQTTAVSGTCVAVLVVHACLPAGG